MIHIPSLKEGLNVFKALASDVRIEIMSLSTKVCKFFISPCF